MANVISFKEHATDRKLHLLIALYDEALHSIVEARHEMEGGHIVSSACVAAAGDDIFSPPSFPAGSTGRKDRHISRAMEIMAELRRSLNTVSAGSVFHGQGDSSADNVTVPENERGSMAVSSGLARNLSRLYLLCTSKLLAARSQMAPEQLDDVALILRKLRNAYALYDKSNSDRKAATCRKSVETSPCRVS